MFLLGARGKGWLHIHFFCQASPSGPPQSVTLACWVLLEKAEPPSPLMFAPHSVCSNWSGSLWIMLNPCLTGLHGFNGYGGWIWFHGFWGGIWHSSSSGWTRCFCMAKQLSSNRFSVVLCWVRCDAWRPVRQARPCAPAWCRLVSVLHVKITKPRYGSGVVRMAPVGSWNWKTFNVHKWWGLLWF